MSNIKSTSELVFNIVVVLVVVLVVAAVILGIVGDFGQMGVDADEKCQSRGYEAGTITWRADVRCYDVMPRGFLGDE